MPEEQQKPRTVRPVKDLKGLYQDPEVNAAMEDLGQFFKRKSKTGVMPFADDREDGYTRQSQLVAPAKLPYVPEPSMFQPDPYVVGRPNEAILAKRMLDLDPATKQRVKGVMFGPTEGSMRLASDSGLSPADFENTNLLGITGNSGMVGVNPGLSVGVKNNRESDATETMAHEFAHQAGYDHDKTGDAEEKLRGFFGFQRPRVSQKEWEATLNELRKLAGDPRYKPEPKSGSK